MRYLGTRGRGRGRGRGRDRGAASIELVGYVTIVVLAAVLCLQGVYATQAVQVAEQAARDGARAWSLGRDVTDAVQRQVPGWAHLQSVSTTRRGDAVEVEVAVRVPIVVRGITSARVVVTRDAVLPED